VRIRFWGTRGSLPKPGPTTLRHGGNTSCVEVRAADGTLVVFDCGTGAHGLGQWLAAAGERPLRGHLLISHTHWDHIQGLPFFAPLFVPGNEWDIYAPGGLGQSLEATLAGQMQYTYFPITLDQLGAVIRYHDLVEGPFSIGGLQAAAQYLNHPALSLGYRLEAAGATVVYATDHEPHVRALPNEIKRGSTRAPLPVHPEDRRHVQFLAEADLLIHDAQYTAVEYAAKIGWGHTPVEWAVDYAIAANVKKLALFHHEPLHDDAAVEAMVDHCRRRVLAAGSRLEVFAAAEGMIVELPERRPSPPEAEGAAHAALPGTPLQVDEPAEPLTVLIADDDPVVLRLLSATLRPDGFRLLEARDGAAALRLARRELPALILLDWHMPAPDGLEVCRALRAEADERLRNVPVVLITAETGADSMALGVAAGVTDYLRKPFSPAHVRSRVTAWLLRTGAPASGSA
jgi:CheY-like chemotaxis protein